MADSDLKEIGINMKGHRNAICAAIQLLPEPEIEPCVPVSASFDILVEHLYS